MRSLSPSQHFRLFPLLSYGTWVGYVQLTETSDKQRLGRGKGFEPLTAGATVRCSTTELTPPYQLAIIQDRTALKCGVAACLIWVSKKISYPRPTPAYL